MKKSKIARALQNIILPYIFIFILFGFAVSCSFLIFLHPLIADLGLTREQIEFAAQTTFYNILFITAVFTVFNLIRRKLTVDRYVKKINNALNEITNGDFSVRLKTTGVTPKFAEIMTSINTMTEELSGVETLKTDFISNVSHEMKTPLAVIGNYATLLQTPNLSESERLEYARVVTASSKRLAELITNILKLNRLENQQIFQNFKNYNLSEQLCECLLQFENTWEEKNIEISTDIPENVDIFADSELLGIVWNNLLSNAFKFTDCGGKVSLVLSVQSQNITVTVSDTGCGMTGDTGMRIFEKFYQGDTSHAAQGNGLGLALVKRIIDIIGGEVTVKSTLGVGSAFTVTIPQSNERAHYE